MRKLLIGLFLLSFTALSYATDNPTLVGFPPNKLMGFKGLDTKSKAPNIEDGRATDLLNVTISPVLDMRKRYGYSVITGNLDDLDMSNPPIEGIFDAEYSTGESYTLAFVGSKLKYDNTTSWATVGGSGTITQGQNYQWQCVIALDNAVCTNDQDPPIKVTKTPTRSAVSFTGADYTVTKSKAVIWYRNYLIWGNTVENSVDNPTRFRWSDVGTIETYSPDNYYDIASLNGDEIVAFREMYGDLYMIMKKSIWKVSLVGGDDVFVFSKIVDGIGSIAKGSVQTVIFPDSKLGIIFLSEDRKVYVFNGVAVYDMGFIIQPTLDGLASSRLDYAVSVFDGDYYYLSVTTSGFSYNDLVLIYSPKVNEWIKYDQINANCFARVKESTALVKTYFGNYNSFVYWLDNPNNVNDVDGAIGTIDGVSTQNNQYMTGAQMIVDSALASGSYTGAIIRITSGTGAGEEQVIMSGAATNIVVAVAFTTTPDSTSAYSIGDINAYYNTKHYDMGDSSRNKSFRKLFMWANEASNNEIITSYAEDFGSTLGSETVDTSPSASSLWDSAIWDSSVWSTTGDKFYTADLRGQGRALQLKFSQPNIDKTFHLYGFHMLADTLDRE